jgi:hypothetical protein
MSVSFWLEGVAMPAVSVFGLLGKLQLGTLNFLIFGKFISKPLK